MLENIKYASSIILLAMAQSDERQLYSQARFTGQQYSQARDEIKINCFFFVFSFGIGRGRGKASKGCVYASQVKSKEVPMAIGLSCLMSQRTMTATQTMWFKILFPLSCPRALGWVASQTVQGCLNSTHSPCAMFFV